jgi:four helix bundle protein
MNKKIKSFRDLNIWIKGIKIVKEVYNLTKSFPSDEMYGLINQMRRAAISISSNISEGFSRVHSAIPGVRWKV